MRNKCLIITICLLLASIVCTGICMGGDLDDKISKYTDDTVSKADELGKPDKNINFIILDAIMKAKTKGGMGKSDGDKNINSIVIGPGANLAGATLTVIPQASK